MNRSLYTKLVLIIILLILSIMTVVGAFLMRGIGSFYIGEFYSQMRMAFDEEMAGDLRSAAGAADAAIALAERLGAFSGRLGIDSVSRNYYVLDGETAEFMAGSDTEGGRALPKTPNILTALTGEAGSESDSTAAYMDIAIPVAGEGGSFIIYIRDDKLTVRSLSTELFGIILRSLLIGLIISVLLTMLLAKTLITPLQSLTRAAERMAGGDFSDKPDNPAKDEIGVLTRTFNDMAAQLEATLDDIKKSEALRKEFVANVSHELRTPITSIRSYAETLDEDGANIPPETAKQFIGVIVNESDRMTKIVQDLLTLSRFDAGSFELTFEWFSFGDSVRDVYNAMQMEAQKRRQELSLVFKTELPEVYGDRARIEQVLINMLSNALKYTHDGGRITMAAGESGAAVWASVSDNGIGIPQEDAEHVFERFYRVDKARSRESGGTGLGLSIAREIILLHDGTIDLKSKPDRGTTITVTMPIGGPDNDELS